jgi:divalent metal cation (Fe/Co/Zn/Cd) transporter
MTFIEFHLVVPGRMTLEDAHIVCNRLERALREEVGDALITIDVEPAHKARQHGVLVL